MRRLQPAHGESAAPAARLHSQISGGGQTFSTFSELQPTSLALSLLFKRLVDTETLA